MKYCITNTRKKFKYIDNVDEITIRFRRQDTTLLDFFQLHKTQRINVYIDDIDDFIESENIELMNAFAEKYPEINFALKFKDQGIDKNKEIAKMIHENKVKHKFFFDTFIRDWDTLFGYIELQPSDVYIVENLGFEIVSVAEILHTANIRVRVFPNIAQSAWKETPALKKFFIRPEDVFFYEPYVDVMEFMGREESIATYYKIYAIDKKWFGKLNEVILDFDDSEIDSRFIIPSFAERRLNCGKRCYKGRPCQICNAIEGLAAVLESENLMVTSIEDN